MDTFYRIVESTLLVVALALGLGVTMTSGPAARATLALAIDLPELSVSADDR